MAKIFQIKISLKNTKPPIWRRIKIDAATDLETFHYILQDVMGWTNSHLFEFTTSDKKRFSIVNDEFEDYEDTTEASEVTLQQVLKRKGSKLTYIYDFGDWWEHQILLEEQTNGPELEIPICITGKKACPPEDCGGLWGYYDMLEVIKDKKHVEHKEMLEWLGSDFDPDHFDKNEVNGLLEN